MAKSGSAPEPDSFVPASFADLRRNSRSEGEAVERVREQRFRTREDLGDLASDKGFMQHSRWIGGAGLVVGAILILAVYLKPMFETAAAVQTAAATAQSSAQQPLSAVSRFAGQASGFRTPDLRVLVRAKGGLSCLTGQPGCVDPVFPAS